MKCIRTACSPSLKRGAVRFCTFYESLRDLLSAFARKEYLSPEEQGSWGEEGGEFEQNCLQKDARMNAEDCVEEFSSARERERASEGGENYTRKGHCVVLHER